MKRNLAILSGFLVAVLSIAAVTTKVDWVSNIKNKPFYDVREFTFSQTPGGSLAIVQSSIVLKPCPAGLNGSDTNHWVYLSGGTGIEEAVLINGGTCVSGANSGTITLAPSHTHTGNWSVSSATAGIQEALNAAGGKNIFIKIPPGAFSVYAGVWIVKGGVTIEGAGTGATVITDFGKTNDLFHFAVDWVNDTSYNRVANMQIVGSGKTAGWEIWATNQWGFDADSLNMHEVANGICLTDSLVSRIRWLILRNFTGQGILIDGATNGGNDIYIDRITLDSGAPHPTAGIHLKTGGGIWITNVDVIHSRDGLLVDPGPGQNVNWAHVVNCNFDTSDEAGILLQTQGGGLNAMRLVNTWASSTVAGPGIYVSTVAGAIDDLRMTGMRLIANGHEGIAVGGSTNTSVEFSSFAGNGNAASNTYSQLFVAGDVSYFRLQGNTFGGIDGQPDISKFGIEIAGATSDHYIVKDNFFKTSGVTGMFAMSGAGRDRIVKDNSPIDTTTPVVASGSTISLPFGPNFTVSGTTGVTTVNGQWTSKSGTFITTDGAVTFTAGGPAGSAIGNTFTTVPNVPVSYYSNGTTIYLH